MDLWHEKHKLSDWDQLLENVQILLLISPNSFIQTRTTVLGYNAWNPVLTEEPPT